MMIGEERGQLVDTGDFLAEGTAQARHRAENSLVSGSKASLCS